MNLSRARALPAAVLLAATAASPVSARGGVLRVCDFESPVASLVGAAGGDLAGPHSAYVVADPVRDGRFAVRFELRPDDPQANNGFRAELFFDPDSMETERWYAWSVYVPAGFTADPVPDIVGQWHGIPDEDLGEDLRHPPVRLRRRHARWELTVTSDARPLFVIGDHAVDTTFVLGAVEERAWTDWVFRMRWSHGPGGFVRAWKNGVPVLRYDGPVGFEDRRGPYFKWGIYKPAWKSGVEPRVRRVLYYDEVRVGTGDGGEALEPKRRQEAAGPGR